MPQDESPPLADVLDVADVDRWVARLAVAPYRGSVAFPPRRRREPIEQRHGSLEI
ncbi:MAG: hypothetical protein ACHRXM_24140 [Isosphaerales bacterium]